MPAYPGGQSALFEFLSKNIKYPVQAEAKGIQGRVIATFVVEQDGSISNVAIAKSVDPLLDKESTRLIKNMPKWIPGKQGGKPVRVKYTLPITYRLSSSKKKPASNLFQARDSVSQQGGDLKNQQATAEGKVLDVVEQMPSFAGGSYTVNVMGADGVMRNETRTCPPGQAGLFQWLASNIKYPVVAEENGVQGRVVVTFIVERDGTINDVKVVKSVDPSLDKEAIRVVKAMPKWNPGKQKGESVRVQYTMPVTFRLK